MLKRTFLAVVLAISSASAANAAPTDCPEHFLSGSAPESVNERLATKARAICYAEFAVLHSGVTRTPLYAAEHLDRRQLRRARGVERDSSFHADPNLPEGERSELPDFVRSGFDRGHMAPSADMPSPAAQQESFSLANIVPQNPDNNRDLWADIESTVRDMARDSGELYVVTGPIFQGSTLQRLRGRVFVPTSLYKAVYDPKRGRGAAYVTPNAEGNKWEAVSLSQLQQLTGIDVFPALSGEAKEDPLPLPKPHSERRGRSRN